MSACWEQRHELTWSFTLELNGGTSGCFPEPAPVQVQTLVRSWGGGLWPGVGGGGVRGLLLQLLTSGCGASDCPPQTDWQTDERQARKWTSDTEEDAHASLPASQQDRSIFLSLTKKQKKDTLSWVNYSVSRCLLRIRTFSLEVMLFLQAISECALHNAVIPS